MEPFAQLKEKKIKKNKYLEDLLISKWEIKHYERETKLMLSEMEECNKKVEGLGRNIADNKG
jgi:DUF438 domain-containing protein